MSKTYSTRAARTRGRGASQRAGQPGQPAAGGQRNQLPLNLTPDRHGQVSDVPTSSQEEQPLERVQRRDAYTMISPDEQKRQSIAAQARREEENYEKHKEKKKLNYVSYKGTVGGEHVTEDKARQQMQQSARTQKFNSQQQRQSYRQAAKERENEDLDKMKAEQRRKSEDNAARQAKEKVDRQKRFQGDQRRKNDEFLKNLEKDSKMKNLTEISGEDERNYETSKRQESGDQGASGGSDEALGLLQRRFPMYDSEVLAEILQQTNGDLSEAMQLLSVV